VNIHWAGVKMTAAFENSQWLHSYLHSSCLLIKAPVDLKQLDVVNPVQV
jgi:hypothetical protein